MILGGIFFVFAFFIFVKFILHIKPAIDTHNKEDLHFVLERANLDQLTQISEVFDGYTSVKGGFSDPYDAYSLKIEPLSDEDLGRSGRWYTTPITDEILIMAIHSAMSSAQYEWFPKDINNGEYLIKFYEIDLWDGYVNGSTILILNKEKDRLFYTRFGI